MKLKFLAYIVPFLAVILPNTHRFLPSQNPNSNKKKSDAEFSDQSTDDIVLYKFREGDFKLIKHSSHSSHSSHKSHSSHQSGKHTSHYSGKHTSHYSGASDCSGCEFDVDENEQLETNNLVAIR